MQQRAIVAAGVAYVLFLGWSMTNATYDVWGLLVAIPPYMLLGILFVRRVFRGELAFLRTIIYVGLVVKLLGSAARYWIGFDVYGGFDALRYHDYAVKASTDVWAGTINPLEVFPAGLTAIGTQFTEGATGFIYLFIGTSLMSGFVAFSFLSFIGTCFFIKAGCTAVPGLAQRKYAWLCVLAPSMMYWPSSIGKEALMMFALGTATYGLALLFTKPAAVAPAVVVIGGLILAAMIRPHFVGMWLAGIFPALLVAFARGRPNADGGPPRKVDRLVMVPIIVVAAIGLIVVAQIAVRYLQPSDHLLEDGQTAGITDIIEETGRRTEQAGSAFEPPSISNPTMWPYASVRTLTRPLPFEVRGAAQLMAGGEMAIFLLMCAYSWRRLLNVPKLILQYPYVAFAMTTLFLGGLAYTSFANYAVLARQRSLVFPFMLLILCVPPIRSLRRQPVLPERHRSGDVWAARADEAIFAGSNESDDQNSSMSPSDTAQFDRGGMPRSVTARHVSTGPPPGRKLKPEDIWG